MLKFKGSEISGLTFMIIIVFLLLGGTVFFVTFLSFDIKAGIATNVNFAVDTDESGSEIVSLLRASNGKITNAELLGSLNSGSITDLDITVIDSKGRKIIDSSGETELSVEIAMPGGRKGSVEV
jgi:uncharacterized membrane protein